MTPELLNLIVNAGGTGILIWLVWEMRAEARNERERIWKLLNYLICERDPNCDEKEALRASVLPRDE